MHTEDKALIEAFQNGDEFAFVSLYNRYKGPIYAFCVMPDHVHLVVGPSRCDIVTFVAQFKNLAQRAAWGLGVRGRIWQTSLWDHFFDARNKSKTSCNMF